jgi:hypothetical protein
MEHTVLHDIVDSVSRRDSVSEPHVIQLSDDSIIIRSGARAGLRRAGGGLPHPWRDVGMRGSTRRPTCPRLEKKWKEVCAVTTDK